MSIWTEESAIRKAKKIGQIDAKAVKGGRNRKPRPWKVVGVWLFHGLKGMPKEYVAYRGVDEAACLKFIEKQARSFYVSRQDQSDRAWSQARERADKRVQMYRIVGPKEVA